MKKPTSVEPNSLGALLVLMGFVSIEQLQHVVSMQQKLDEEELLGRLMVAESVLTPVQLTEVLTIQRGLRSKSKFDQAMAQAALAERSHDHVNATAVRIRQKIGPLRSITRELTPRVVPEGSG